MDSLKNKYNSVREEGIRNKVSAVRGDGFRNKVLNRGDKGSSAVPAYTPRPITELKDPSSFPPPPRRRTTDPHNLTTPPPPPTRTASSYSTTSQPPAPTPRAAPPSLPPRLPPRAPPITMEDRDDNNPDPYINQSAASRLGASGISVPDLGISSRAHQSQSETQGTSWAQKKSALKTIGDFNRDPSSVSLQDARTAAATANNFRERHGAEVARGAKTAGELNQKYGVAERVGGYAGDGGAAASASSLASVAGKKRPPPPPPPKKASLSGGGQAGNKPPPLPMSSKPRF
ncbi:uncharacterized protein DNG_07202 [Cephalotrichum gorgonifer]|uniref:Uncharacterized protein n=1 Tax=Cephalotrichum gorgonifer TaxID=2041049 RepID=A0AAE8SXZ8_9PEZI|nr:uncharacterized protein DNG_07202 [Cephalotrichum gorgonifer]